MVLRSRALLLITLVALAMTPASPTVASEASTDSEDRASMTVDEARRFRAELGLDTDTALLENLARSTVVSESFGLPLSPEEEALLQVRLRIQSELRPLGSYKREHQDVSAGCGSVMHPELPWTTRRPSTWP